MKQNVPFFTKIKLYLCVSRVKQNHVYRPPPSSFLVATSFLLFTIEKIIDLIFYLDDLPKNLVLQIYHGPKLHWTKLCVFKSTTLII